MDDELDMLRSLRVAESSKDELQIQQAQERILRNSGWGSSGNHAAYRRDRPSKAPVSRLLRHDKQCNPVVLCESTSVQEVAQQLCSKRQSAALVLKKGEKVLCGICSEVDICRRLVGQGLAPTVPVSKIMTKNPRVVSPDDDFSVVLQMMVKHRFRHLPVVTKASSAATTTTNRRRASGESQDREDKICGLIDITQCLYDTIHKIERLQDNQKEFFRAVQVAQDQTGNNSKMDRDEADEIAQRTLKALMDSISPTVGTVVQEKSLLKLDESATVKDAALAMKEARMTAVVVFRDTRFVGILTCKDVMSRVVAKGLDPSSTNVGTVMTPNPDTVRRNSSVLDALHIMQTERYLHLPVVEVVADPPEEPQLVDQSSSTANESSTTTDATTGEGATAVVAIPAKADEENLGKASADSSNNISSSSSNGGGAVKNNGDSGAGGSGSLRLCGVLSVLDCAVHTFASSSRTAAQVLSSSAPARKSIPHSQLYYPTPMHASSFPTFGSFQSIYSETADPLSIPPHQQWRDPDSLSAFSEVRSSRGSRTGYDDTPKFGEEETEAADLASNNNNNNNNDKSKSHGNKQKQQEERDATHRKYWRRSSAGSGPNESDAELAIRAASPAAAAASTHLGANESSAERRANLVIKVKDKRDGKVYRLSNSSVKTLRDLLVQLEKATGRDADDINLVYLDEDRDHVQLANDLALKEARALAHQQGWRKIDVFILSTNKRFDSGPNVFSSSDPVLVAGLVLASVAVVAIIGLALFPRQQTYSSGYRRYR